VSWLTKWDSGPRAAKYKKFLSDFLSCEFGATAKEQSRFLR
jgi:hypothetical protein